MSKAPGIMLAIGSICSQSVWLSSRRRFRKWRKRALADFSLLLIPIVLPSGEPEIGWSGRYKC